MLPTKSDQAVAAVESPTFLHVVQFCSSSVSYRIVRLTIELFLVQYTIELGNSAAVAGFVFLAYSLADVFAALFSLWKPLLWTGSIFRGSCFVVFTGATMILGLMGLFYSTSILMMILSGIICGFGTSTWFVHYQTLTNKAFFSMTKLAQTRQIFESFGFLLPSITLAVVMQDSSNSLNVIKTSTAVLVGISILFLLISSTQVIKHSANCGSRTSDVSTQSVWRAIKVFFTSSIIKYFFLDTLILSMSSILFGSLAVSTELYFGLDPTFLWLGVIGIPFGGAFAGFCGIKGWFTHNDDRQVVLNGTMITGAIFLIMIIVGPPSTASVSTKKLNLLLFGLGVGFFWSKAYISAFALWLRKLREEPRDFITRANVLHNIGVQLLVASIFQVQMVLLDSMAEKELQHPQIKGFYLFGLIVLLNVVAHLVARRIPYPPDSRFSWPVPTPYTYTKKMLIKIVSTLTGFSIEDLVFVVFTEFKVSHFARHLSDDALSCIEGGPGVPPDESLTPESLELHLRRFDDIGSKEEWWKSSVSVDCFLMSNSACFKKRCELIDMATSSICIVTWSLTGISGRVIVDKLIKRKSEGLDVRVIVDAANLYCLYELYHIEKKSTDTDVNNTLALLSSLKQGGVEVRMLDSWCDIDTDQPYLIGMHRKLMLIDEKWLLTGGRNLEDSYANPEGDQKKFTFVDSDVVLKGNFADTTANHFQELWVRSRPAKTNRLTQTAYKDFNLECFALPEDIDDVDESSSIFETIHSGVSSFYASVKADGTTNDVDGTSSFRSKSIYKVRSSFFRSASSFAFDMESLSDDTSREVSLFQLDHKAGRTDGKDIILSTVLFLIATARSRIDIMFGYLQLCPVLENALKKAIARGVEVRVFTNSEETNDVFILKNAFRQAFSALIDIGVKVYTPREGAVKTIHTKMLLVDSRALLIGSWNAWAYSVFYEEEFSVLLLDDEESSMFKPVESFYDKLVQEGYFSQMNNAPPVSDISPIVKACMTKYGRRQYEKGF